MTSQQQIRKQVREVLARLIQDNIESELSDDDDIIIAGIDSVGMMMLITELEQTFSISLDGDDIPYERFRTVADIAAFIESILNRGGQAGT
jgi:acyl carrier protein